MSIFQIIKNLFNPNYSTTMIRTSPKVGRNEVCPCNSGNKFKKCCLGNWGK